MKTILPLLLLCAAPVWASLPYAYVTGTNNVTAIDWTTNNEVASIPVIGTPTSIAITPNGAFVYVASWLTNTSVTVSVIATSTNTVMATIPIAVNASFLSELSLAMAPDGAHLYLAAGSLTVISTATNTVMTVIPVEGAFSVAITPDGKFAWVTQYVSGGGVLVVATAANTVVATIPVQGSELPWGVAITPNGQFAYITSPGTNSVFVASTATKTRVATLQEVGANPLGLAVTPDGASVYLANASGPVSVVATATNVLQASIPVGGPPPRALAFSPDGTLAYAPIGLGLKAINVATNTVSTPIPTFTYGDAVAFVPAAPPSLPNSPMQLIVKGTQMCLDIQFYSYQPVAPATQYWCEGGLNQRWLPAAVGDGSFTLTAQHSGEVLDVTGGSTATGAQPVQYPYWGGRNQHWYFEPTIDGFYHVVSQNSGLCLDIVTAAQTPALSQQNTCGASDSQKWQLVPWR